MNYVIGIDLGTSATKTVLFDETGAVIASASREYPLYQPQNGWAEQKPSDWWTAACETLSEVTEKSGITDITAIGLSGQMHGLVMLDENGEVLRDSIIWCDQRTAKQCDEITEKVGRERLIEITANPAITGFTASKILWVRENEPELWQRCRHILLPKDYLRYKLTGAFATEVSDASGMQLLDVPKRDWSDEVLEKLEIPREYLGKVYESPEITGHITSEAEMLTSIKAGTPVVGGAGDNAAAAIGLGIVTEGSAFTSIGTSGVVFAHSDNPVIDPDGRVHTFCCAVPGAWHIMGVTQAAGLSLQWFRNTFCSEEMQIAGEENVDPYVIMDKMAAQSGIGARGLIYLPYLMGERTPHLDPDCRGTFFGISSIHDKGDFIRAVMEGVAYSLTDCTEILREMGAGAERMIVTGGGAKSKLWREILAGCYNIPVSTSKSSEGPALGVAILAAVGGGIYPDVRTACEKMTATGTETTAENHDTYMRKYDTYKALYPALKELFKAERK